MASELEKDKLKIKRVLSATIASLCNNGLNFELELRIEGLIGITIDKESVFLVNINEVLPSKKKKSFESQNKKATGATKSNESNKKYKRPGDASLPIKKEPQSPSSGSNPPKESQKQFQDQTFTVKEEHQKMVSERLETECLSMQQHDGGYSEVQKSVKTVQHPEGVIEQKQVEWKTYDASGNVLEHKKVEAVQTMPQSLIHSDPQYVQSGMGSQSCSSQGNEMYDSQQQGYYYDQEYDNYSQDYAEEQEYYNQQAAFDPDFNSNQQAFASGGKRGAAKRGAKRGSRGGVAMRADSTDQRHSATTSSAGCKSSAKGASKSKQQFRQPPQKRQCFQQQQQQQQFQEHYPATPTTAQGSYASPKPQTPKSRPGKDLLKRAMHLVTEGKVSAGTAINLFGIPKSTFYKELSNYKKTMEEYQGEGFPCGEEWTEDSGGCADYDYSGYEGYQ